jgi:hypothetical protein
MIITIPISVVVAVTVMVAVTIMLMANELALLTFHDHALSLLTLLRVCKTHLALLFAKTITSSLITSIITISVTIAITITVAFVSQRRYRIS